MNYANITNSNPTPEVNNKYCQLLLEDLYFSYLEMKGFPTTKREKWVQDVFKASITGYEIENKRLTLEIVRQAFAKFCDYPTHTFEEDSWTFDNLIAILGKRGPYSGHSSVEINLLKNTSNKLLMYYLNTSKFRSSEEYSDTDVNLYKDVMMKALTMVDLSTNATSLSWFASGPRKPWSIAYYDSTSERIQQVLEKPWKEIQQTYLNILSEFHEIPATHLKYLSQIPSEVLYFSYQQRILRYLPVAIDVIEKSFSTTITELRMVSEKDSETAEEWLEFNIRIKGEIEEVLDNYDKYTNLLVSSLPWSARYKMRLSYKIV